MPRRSFATSPPRARSPTSSATPTAAPAKDQPPCTKGYFCFGAILYPICSYVVRGRIFFGTNSSFHW